MAKILIISAVFPPEPVVSAKLSYDFAKALSERHKVTVISPKPSRPFGFQFTGESILFNFKHIQADSFVDASSGILGRIRESYSFGNYCYSYIANHYQEIDIIYANTWPLMGQYVTVKAARKFRIPIVLHIQDIYPESLTGKLPKNLRNFFYKILLPLDKYILQHSTKIVGISENMVSYLSKTRRIDKSKFMVVRNWQEDDAFLNFVANKRQQSAFTFMYVGSVSTSAGVELLLYAFDKAALSDSRLVIVGNGNEKDKCIRIANELKNQGIQFLEVIPSDVPSIQSRADVLLLPLKKGISLTATPSKLTAYLFSAKPVIACVEKESDVANILKEANCGFVVDPENAENLKIAMKRLYEMEEVDLKEMGEKGKDYALSNLSKKTNLNKVVTIIEDALQWK